MGSWILGGVPACLLAFTLLVGHGASAAPRGGSWQVVLAAGDDAEPVFDDATRALARRFAAAGVPAANIHRLSADPAELRRGVEPATAEILLRLIAELPARPDDRCFVFMTSHGERDAGLWLAPSHRALRPEELAQALARGCAAVPTVVIASGCYSGGFAAGAMTGPNRIILTAARRDRPSFGCQVERTYTFFDQCLLGALPNATNWRAVFAGTSRCVSREEHALGERPSEPQAYFGPVVADMRIAF
jgi:Peptidase C13 family